ncbi:MAG TPA: hypothetical protein VIF62_17995 [Labilithrix sp.]|jgi:hypothetical protein
MRRSSIVLAALVLAGCGGARRFPVKDPVWRDTDLDPVNIACAKRASEKEPSHVACAPEPYISPLVWDGADNIFFRPVAKIFAVDPPQEARNVNAFDEVPDSAWFTNRMGKKKPSFDELLRGACKESDMLDGSKATPETWVIDQGKPNGASPGFRMKIDGKKKYMFKTDSKEQPERPSAASAIGAAIYHAVGFHTSCEQIVYVRKDALKLTPGLRFTANTGVTHDFDAKALDKVFEEASPRGDTFRFQASAWLPGYLLGPFKYEKTRSDDPNDVIPHEDRRDLRGARVLAAWLNHFDAREQNSMDSWIATNAKVPDSSPGFVRHYYLDTSDVFGSEWDFDAISRRLGHSYLLDFGDIGLDFITLGTLVRPWEREKKGPPGTEMFGYFHWREFEPDDWKNEYPNPAFSRATEHDNAWMARILSRLDYADVKGLVGLGKFTNPEASDYLALVLEMRLRKIVERYLLNLSPLSDFTLSGDTLCGVDLARRRAARPESAFKYAATANGASLAVEAQDEGRICMRVPAGDYTVVSIANGASKGRALVHVAGGRVVGLQRPDP